METSYKTSTMGLFDYLNNTDDLMPKLVHLRENSKKLHSIVKKANKFSQKFCLNPVDKNALKTIKFFKKMKKIAKQEISWQICNKM